MDLSDTDATVESPQDVVEPADQAGKRKPYILSRGVKFPKDGVFITGMLRKSVREETYETREAEALLKVAKPEDVVIELGAGIGYMSSLAAKQCNVKAVHAFEANPYLIPYIQSVYDENDIKNAQIHNAILGKRKGSAKFYVRRRMIESSMDKLDGNDIRSVEDIEVRNANQTFRKIKPTLLICDIEGAEAHLLPHIDLSNLRAAIVEIHPQWIGPQGVNAVFEAMMKAGLAYYSKTSGSKVITFRRTW